MTVSELPLLGPVSESMLAKAGIHSKEELQKLGAIEAYCLVKKAGCKPSKNFLYALHGALNNLSWREASSGQTRGQLLLELEAFEEIFFQ